MKHTRGHTTAGAAVALALAVSAAHAAISIGVSVNIAPPPLPVYEQPPIPGSGYIWTPGYWAYSDDGYYWVPGTWVEPPQADMLWTPGYWGWNDGVYLWHEGYWGPHVGFYGGVNYGFGYVGVGYLGGHWDHGAFFYNRSVNNVPGSVHITNVYNQTVVNHVTVNRVSYNGGHGGLPARPTPNELAYSHEAHSMPVSMQLRQQQLAHDNPSLRNAVNHGHPSVAATSRPGEFSGRGVVAAHNASLESGRPQAPRPGSHGAATAHVNRQPLNAPGNPRAAAVHNEPVVRSAPNADRQPPQAQQHNAPQTRVAHLQPQPRPEHSSAPPQGHGGNPGEHRASPGGQGGEHEKREPQR